MSDDLRVEEDQPEDRDEALARVLQDWTVARPESLDKRLLAAFRRRTRPRGLRRAWTASVRVPVPLLAAFLLAFAALCLRVASPSAAVPPAPTRAPAVRIVLETRSLQGFRPLTRSEIGSPVVPR